MDRDFLYQRDTIKRSDQYGVAGERSERSMERPCPIWLDKYERYREEPQYFKPRMGAICCPPIGILGYHSKHLHAVPEAMIRTLFASLRERGGRYNAS